MCGEVGVICREGIHEAETHKTATEGTEDNEISLTTPFRVSIAQSIR